MSWFAKKFICRYWQDQPVPTLDTQRTKSRGFEGFQVFNFAKNFFVGYRNHFRRFLSCSKPAPAKVRSWGGWLKFLKIIRGCFQKNNKKYFLIRWTFTSVNTKKLLKVSSLPKKFISVYKSCKHLQNPSLPTLDT